MPTIPIASSIAHAISPDDFELYIVALMIVDDDNPVLPIVDMMVFPVNPSSMMELEQTYAVIKKSFSGINVVDNETFVAVPITISGSFGRMQRLMFSGQNTFSLKTGYGATRYLRNLINLGRQKNNKGTPYRTVFYNLAFNSVYTVVVNRCAFNMTEGTNKIWHYNLSMDAVAPGNINNSLSEIAVISGAVAADFFNTLFQQAAQSIASLIS